MRIRVSLTRFSVVPYGTLTLGVFLSPLPSSPPSLSISPFSLTLCQAIPHGPASEFSGIFHGRIVTSLSHASTSYISVLVAPAVNCSIVCSYHSFPTISFLFAPVVSRATILLITAGSRYFGTLFVGKELYRLVQKIFFFYTWMKYRTKETCTFLTIANEILIKF